MGLYSKTAHIPIFDISVVHLKYLNLGMSLAATGVMSLMATHISFDWPSNAAAFWHGGGVSSAVGKPAAMRPLWPYLGIVGYTDVCVFLNICILLYFIWCIYVAFWLMSSLCLCLPAGRDVQMLFCTRCSRVTLRNLLRIFQFLSGTALISYFLICLTI